MRREILIGKESLNLFPNSINEACERKMYVSLPRKFLCSESLEGMRWETKNNTLSILLNYGCLIVNLKVFFNSNGVD
jgi:hypothetical protein